MSMFIYGNEKYTVNLPWNWLLSFKLTFSYDCCASVTLLNLLPSSWAKCNMSETENTANPEYALVVTLPVGVRSWHPMRLFTWLLLSLPPHGHIHYFKSSVTMETDCIITLDVHIFRLADEQLTGCLVADVNDKCKGSRSTFIAVRFLGIFIRK